LRNSAPPAPRVEPEAAAVESEAAEGQTPAADGEPGGPEPVAEDGQG
jgi:hypothetical protein